MTTYKEVVESSPVIRQLNALNANIKLHEDNLRLWVDNVRKAKRPYPNWNSPAIGWVKIRKLLMEEHGLDGKKDQKTLIAYRDDLLDVAHRGPYAEWVAEATAKARILVHGLAQQADKEFREYAADDTKQLFKLARYAKKRLDKEGTWEWVYKVEHEVLRVCIQAEIDGMPMDLDLLKSKQEVLNPVVEDLKNRIHELAGDWDFKPSSTSDLPRVIFGDMRVPPPVFEIRTINGHDYHLPNTNKWGKEYCTENNFIPDCRKPDDMPAEFRERGLSTSKVTLELLEHPIGQAVLDWRVADKLRSTYLESMIPILEATDDSVIHARFKSIGAKATGRFSIVNPNLQTLPSRGKGREYDERVQRFGPTLRETFVAPPPDEEFPEGYSLVISDLSQIELRLIAHQTKDKKLLEVYNEYVTVEDQTHYTGDIHLATQTSMNVPRKAAKALNFGMCYGVGGAKFARMNCMLIPGTSLYDVDTANEYKRGFFHTYQGIESYTNNLKVAWYDGQRNFPMLSGRYRHWLFDRVAPSKILNSQIQGSASDILKLQIAAFNRHVVPLYPGLRFALQVHDELAYICPNKYIEEVSWLVKYVMEFPFMNLRVPLLAGAKICKSWACAADDNVPEVGVQFARINGEDKLFDEHNWEEFVAADEAGIIELKGAAAMLSPDQLKFCAEKLNNLTPAQSTETFLTREELMAQRV